MELSTGFLEHGVPTQDEHDVARTMDKTLSSIYESTHSRDANPLSPRLRLLKIYLSSSERHEKIALGLSTKAEYFQDLSHQVDAYQCQLGDPTEAQRLAGEAALRRLCVSSYSQNDGALHQIRPVAVELDPLGDCEEVSSVKDVLDGADGLGRPQALLAAMKEASSNPVNAQEINSVDLLHSQPGPLIIPWHVSNEAPIPELHKKSASYTTNSRETGSLSGTVPTSIGIHELVLADASGGQGTLKRAEKKCFYCGLDMACCKRTMGCIDAYSMEDMPLGVWDLSQLSHVLSELGEQGRSEGCSNSVASVSPISEGKELNAFKAPSSGVSEEIPEGFRYGASSLCSYNASEPGSGFDDEYDFTLSDVQKEIAIDLQKEVYKRLAKVDLKDAVFTRLAKKGPSIGQKHAGAEQPPDGAGPKDLGTSESKTPLSALLGPSLKRHRARSVSERSGGSEKRPRKRPNPARNSTHRPEHGAIFSCPYLKGNPTARHSKKCTNHGLGWLDITSLKNNHLYQHHDGLKGDKDFFSDDALKAWSDRGPHDSMSLDEKWLAIFKRIYKTWLTGFKAYPSPYFNPAETVEEQNSKLLSLIRHDPEAQPAIVQYLAPAVVSQVLDSRTEPEEATRPWQVTIKRAVGDVILNYWENSDVVTLSNIKGMIRHPETISQRSEIQSTAADDSLPHFEHYQDFDTRAGHQTNDSLRGLDSPWDPEWIPNGSEFPDSTYGSMPNSSEEFSLELEQLLATDYTELDSYPPQPNPGMVGHALGPWNSTLFQGEVLSPLGAVVAAQPDRPPLELESLGLHTEQLTEGLEGDSRAYPDRPQLSATYFQPHPPPPPPPPPPLNCPTATEDCGPCTLERKISCSH